MKIKRFCSAKIPYMKSNDKECTWKNDCGMYVRGPILFIQKEFLKISKNKDGQ